MVTAKATEPESRSENRFPNDRIAAPGFNLKSVLRVVLIMLPIWGLIYNLHLERYFGLQMYTGHYNAGFVGIAFTLVFLMFPAGKNIKPARWYDFILAALSIVVCGYYGFNYTKMVLTTAYAFTTVDVVFGTILVLIVLEAVRRTTGWPMIIVAVFFIVHALYGLSFPSFLRAPSISYERLITTSYLTENGMLGFIMRICSTYIIAFATLGGMLIAFGWGEKLTRLALALVGHVRGGAAKVAIVSSSILGTMSGDPISNVGISGSFSLPMMKKMGFKPAMAAAVETVGSTGGVLMPPMMGAIIFIMVEMTGIPYAEIMKAAILPSLLYFLAIYLQIDFWCKKNNMSGLPASELPSRRLVLYENKVIFIVFIALIYFLAVMRVFPAKAAYYASGLMVVLMLFDRMSQISFRRFVNALETAGSFTIKIVPLMAAAGLVLASLTLTGTGVRLATRMLNVAGGSLLVLVLLTVVICYFLGMGVSAMLAYVILSAIVAPALVQFGIPTLAAHFFIIYAGLFGFFTPPYAVVALTASNFAGAEFYQTCWISMKLAIYFYIGTSLVCIGLVLFFFHSRRLRAQTVI